MATGDAGLRGIKEHGTALVALDVRLSRLELLNGWSIPTLRTLRLVTSTEHVPDRRATFFQSLEKLTLGFYARLESWVDVVPRGAAICFADWGRSVVTYVERDGARWITLTRVRADAIRNLNLIFADFDASGVCVSIEECDEEVEAWAGLRF